MITLRLAQRPDLLQNIEMTRVIFALIVIGVLAACAQAPESIQPTYVSEVPDSTWSCQQLADEQLRLDSALATASTQQSNARTNDTIGVLLVGVPVSSLSGSNIAPQIALYKGQQEAVRRASTSKQCGSPQSPPQAH